MKEQLKLMVEALINEDSEKASKYFHEYLSESIKSQLNIENTDEVISEETEDKK